MAMESFRCFSAIRRLACIVGFCTLTLTAVAAEPRFALVVGNGKYQGLGALKNPVNDATDVAKALTALGFKVELLTDTDLVSMEEALARLGDRLKGQKDACGFFYYAGHGVQGSDGGNYLIPVDARIPSEAFLKSKAFSAQMVLDVLQDSGNALNVVVLDACRDNPFSWSRSAGRGLSMVRSQPPGSLIAYATSAGSVAQDGTGRNGLFTTHLLKYLASPGLEIKDVFNQTGKAVRDASGGSQVPAVYNQFFDSAWLAGKPAPVEPRVVYADRDAALPGALFTSTFEDNDLSGWVPRENAPGGKLARETGLAHSGSAALSIRDRRIFWDGASLDVGEYLKPGAWYRFKAWVRHEEKKPFVPFNATLMSDPDKGTPAFLTLATGLVPPGAWTALEGLVQIPGDWKGGRSMLFVENTFLQKGDRIPEYLLDDVSLAEVPDVAALAPFRFDRWMRAVPDDRSLVPLKVELLAGKAPEVVVYESCDPGVAMVTPDGQVMGLKPGRTFVSARSPTGVQAVCEVTVYHPKDMKTVFRYTFDARAEADAIGWVHTTDWSVQPPRESHGVATKRVVAGAGSGGAGDGALQVDFRNEDLGYLDVQMDVRGLPPRLPGGTVIRLLAKSSLPGVILGAGILKGSPDWAWYGEASPWVSLGKEWTCVEWVLPADMALSTAGDGLLKIAFRKEKGTGPVETAGTVWVDSLEMLLPPK